MAWLNTSQLRQDLKSTTPQRSRARHDNDPERPGSGAVLRVDHKQEVPRLDAERTLPRTGQQDLLQLGRTSVQAGSERLQSGGSQAKAKAALVTPLVTEIGRHIRPTESCAMDPTFLAILAASTS